MDCVPAVQVLCELREVPEALEQVQSPSCPCILPTNRADDDDNSRNNSPTLKLGCWDRSVSFSLPSTPTRMGRPLWEQPQPEQRG